MMEDGKRMAGNGGRRLSAERMLFGLYWLERIVFSLSLSIKKKNPESFLGCFCLSEPNFIIGDKRWDDEEEQRNCDL